MHFRNFAAAVALILAMFPAFAQAAPPAFGTYLHPDAADSLWNARPVAPVLGTYAIPKTSIPRASAPGRTRPVFSSPARATPTRSR